MVKPFLTKEQANAVTEQLNTRMLDAIFDVIKPLVIEETQVDRPLPSSPTPTNKPNFFPDPYNDIMQIEDKGDHYTARASRWMDRNGFSTVAAIVKELGGKWVSAGKASYFEIPKKA